VGCSCSIGRRPFNSRIGNSDYSGTVVEFISTSILHPSSILRCSSVIITFCTTYALNSLIDTMSYLSHHFSCDDFEDLDPAAVHGTLGRYYQLSNPHCDKTRRRI
jgi:hypothetical protein